MVKFSGFRMSRSNYQPVGDARARRYAWERWVIDNGPYDFYVTLNFNQEETVAGARRKIAKLFARVDNDILGRSWSRQVDRTFAIGVIEHPQTNLHSHALWRLPLLVGERGQRFTPSRIAEHWRGLTFYRGSADLQAVYDLSGVANYLSKELVRDTQWENFYTAAEFHRR